MSLCIVSIEERFMIKSRLIWCAYSSFKKKTGYFLRTRYFGNLKPASKLVLHKNIPKTLDQLLQDFQNGLSYLQLVNKHDNSLWMIDQKIFLLIHCLFLYQKNIQIIQISVFYIYLSNIELKLMISSRSLPFSSN